jgi:hypothetical protein
MTSIKKLIFDINKKSNFDILDSININYITYNDAKLLINNFYEECINSKLKNLIKLLKFLVIKQIYVFIYIVKKILIRYLN